MCGIAGFVRVDPWEEDGPLPDSFVTYFSAVLHAIAQRGPDSFGIGEFSVGIDPLVFKDCASPLRIDQRLEQIADDYRGGYVLAGFRGVATTEFWDKTDPRCVQPYTSGENPEDTSAVVHNGIISNDKQLAEARGYRMPLIDSYLLLDHFVADYSSADTRSRLAELESGSAFALYSASEDELLLARNFRGLAVALWQGQGETILVWASEEEALKQHFDPKTTVVSAELPLWSYYRGSPEVLWHRGISPSYYLKTLIDHCIAFDDSDAASSRCAVVCSGGMDSTTVAMLACQQFAEVYLLHFDYGARAAISEHDAVYAIAQWLRDNTRAKVDLHFIDLTFLRELGGSTLTEHHRLLAQGELGAESAHEWVPARNTAMIGLAASFCDRHHIGNLALGLNMEEGSVYPDNSQEFYFAMEKALQLGTRARPKLWMPLGYAMKHAIVKQALEIDAPLHLSYSCYQAGPMHCGVCGSCIMRRKAYLMNDLEDPVFYEHPLPNTL